MASRSIPDQQVLLGDEAVALAAADAGISAAYAYPGTPSTEILEFLIAHERNAGGPHAAWCANEKTALEAALGMSFAGKRALVAMKHVGLNVAADPFVNAALVAIQGGLVIAVADDPGMHSSQNEQDSRCLADFARTICLEPSNQQEAYAMTRDAFDLSERFEVPVMVRLVTRLAHSRAVVETAPRREENQLRRPAAADWTLLPGNARRRWRSLVDRQAQLQAFSDTTRHNQLDLNGQWRKLGVITTGLARNYYLENIADLADRPSHLHIGAYPLPKAKIQELVEHVDRVLVLEEGYPYLERYLRGLIPSDKITLGKESGEVPPTGELTPDVVRGSLGLEVAEGVAAPELSLPMRPPQLCKGCPHADSFTALKQALEGMDQAVVTADIGCYTLGALPPYSAIESCVCMGASIGMARGAAEAGFSPAVAVIGDSTFTHSGIAPLIDAVAADADMTVLILDNGTVAMTGAQPPVLPGERIEKLARAAGVAPERLHHIELHPKRVGELTTLLRNEVAHRGLSVIIARRVCIEAVRRNKEMRGTV